VKTSFVLAAIICQAPKSANSNYQKATQIVVYYIIYRAAQNNRRIDAFEDLECFFGARTVSRKEVARKSRHVQTRITRRDVAHNPFPVEYFFSTRCSKSGETTVALLNSLLAGASRPSRTTDDCCSTWSSLQKVI